MTPAKKKVADEASDSTETVDTETVAVPDVDPSKEVKPDPEPESTDVDEPVEDTSVASAQGLLGVPVTGTFNHATKMALRVRQRELGLPPSGQLDARTKRRLGI